VGASPHEPLKKERHMNPNGTFLQATKWWRESALHGLGQFGRIPNITVGSDPDWKKNGHMDRAFQVLMEWSGSQTIRNITIEKLELPNLTPILLMQVPGTIPGRVLIYGHADKQPPGKGWKTSPWEPVIEGDKFYGRGLADDGYATFAAITAIRLLQYGKPRPHPHITILIEGSEESGSVHLPAYLDKFAEEIGTPDLVICLDSGGGDYDHLWITSSLRGVVNGDLTVRVLTQDKHSGSASGIVPDCVAIACHLQDRVRNSLTGEVYPLELSTTTPPDRAREICQAAKTLGTGIFEHFPWYGSTQPDISRGLNRLLFANTWKPTMTVTGQEGTPSLSEAKNSIQAFITQRLSFRLPPTVDHNQAADVIKRILEANPPYKADVSFTVKHKAPGFNAPQLAPWLAESMNRASLNYFGAEAMAGGEGGTIPFMGMIKGSFPNAQLLATGVLGPDSNEHGPNESLRIPNAIQVTAVVADVIADFQKD